VEWFPGSVMSNVCLLVTIPPCLIETS